MHRLQLRLRIGLALFWALSAVVFARLIALELSQGDAFRSEAAQPLTRCCALPAIRGRILGRDGSVLAHDEPCIALSLHYRQLESPPQPQWLRRQARSRLTAAERRNALRVAQEEQRVLAEHALLHQHLAELCGVPRAEWQARLARIQDQVQSISHRVNQRREDTANREATAADAASGATGATRGTALWRRLVHAWNSLADAPAPAAIIVAEERRYQTIADPLPLSVQAEIEAHPELYPGVRIERRSHRKYPGGELACHVLGHLGPADGVGQMGIERHYEAELAGLPGEVIEVVRRDGQLVSRTTPCEPVAGRDLLLTLDLEVQRAAEALLQEACQRAELLTTFSRAAHRSGPGSAAAAGTGGAIVVLDVQSGAILAAASAPRFDPSLLSPARGGLSLEDAAAVGALLNDPRHALFDRATRMAIPPGSVFKTVAAAALLESGFAANRAIVCRGYFAQPQRERCSLFIRQGIGHGEMLLGDALAQSCNVYFFEAATRMGPAALVEWAGRLGLGRPTGIDLPQENAGQIPALTTVETEQDWSDDATRLLAIGQGAVTATPLQAARMMAAVANGGRLVTPHVVQSPTGSPQPIPGLRPSTLRTLQAALVRVVADAEGTAHDAVHLDTVAIAGKTGTAETGDGLAEHAWFAGYAPAGAPRVAFAIVLEHAGNGAASAGPVARRLIQRMEQLGYFDPTSKDDS